jgi:hypothetical protein
LISQWCPWNKATKEWQKDVGGDREDEIVEWRVFNNCLLFFFFTPLTSSLNPNKKGTASGFLGTAFFNTLTDYWITVHLKKLLPNGFFGFLTSNRTDETRTRADEIALAVETEDQRQTKT